jgi:hypothetical protein
MSAPSAILASWDSHQTDKLAMRRMIWRWLSSKIAVGGVAACRERFFVTAPGVVE